jgi:hypothetical protein
MAQGQWDLARADFERAQALAPCLSIVTDNLLTLDAAQLAFAAN